MRLNHLQLNALHQRYHRYVATHDHIAGTTNAMLTDNVSRLHLWHLADAVLLTDFNHSYPQALLWRLSTMHNNLPPDPYTIPLLPSTTRPLHHPLAAFKASPNMSATGSSLPAARPSALAQWRTPCERWVRRSLGCPDPRMNTHGAVPWIVDSLPCTAHGPMRTTLPRASSPFR